MIVVSFLNASVGSEIHIIPEEFPYTKILSQSLERELNKNNEEALMFSGDRTLWMSLRTLSWNTFSSVGLHPHIVRSNTKNETATFFFIFPLLQCQLI
jgi:hypothetical protein